MAPLRPGAHEIETWAALINDRLAGGQGLPVMTLGTRIGPQEAERAELTNLAARHIHTMRARLVDENAIVTVRHAYRLATTESVGMVR